MKIDRKQTSAFLTLGLLAAGGSANATLLLEESFDYPAGTIDGAAYDGGIGFDSAWVQTGWSRPYLVGNTSFSNGAGTTINAVGGLEYPGLITAGSGLSRFGTAGQRALTRTPGAASLSALTADNSTIWFSTLVSGPAGNKFGTMVFGTDTLYADQSGAPFSNGNLASNSGQAFGVGLRGPGDPAGGGSGSPNAVAFVNSSAASVNVGSYTPPIDGTHHDVTLVVGKINWNPNGTADELFLFNVTDPGGSAPGEGDAIASISADFDQSNFDTISLWDTGSTIYDEIRFGTTFASVTPVPEPSSLLYLTVAGGFLLRRRRG